jgi:hypothetical protein
MRRAAETLDFSVLSHGNRQGLPGGDCRGEHQKLFAMTSRASTPC